MTVLFECVSHSVLHLFPDQVVTSEETHVVATSSQALARFSRTAPSLIALIFDPDMVSW